jgi:Glycosyl transferase family 2
MTEYSPIVLFCYKRLGSVKQTLDSLKKNKLAPESLLHIFSDGAKGPEDEGPVAEVREWLRAVDGFKEIRITESPVNKGLANSVIAGVSQVINEYGSVIVVEDDLVLAPHFLAYMNAALRKYEQVPAVHSISGFIFDIGPQPDFPYDVFFTRRLCSWGWGLWKDRWNAIDWEVKDFPAFSLSASEKRAFNHIGSDLVSMLDKQMMGKIDSWAIRCIFHQFRNHSYTAYPLKSMVLNKGFGEGATHTNMRVSRYRATLDKEERYDFRFPDAVVENEMLLRKFRRKYSRLTRLYYYGINKILAI